MHSIFRLHLLHIKVCKYRRSHWRWSVKKVFLKLSRNSQANTCQSLFFNKVAEWGLQTEASFEKETPRQVLSCEFCEILKNIFLTKHLWMIASIGTISSWIFLKCFFFFFLNHCRKFLTWFFKQHPQKQSPKCALWKCSEKFPKIHRKIPVQVASGLQLYSKRGSATGVFLRVLQNF